MDRKKAQPKSEIVWWRSRPTAISSVTSPQFLSNYFPGDDIQNLPFESDFGRQEFSPVYRIFFNRSRFNLLYHLHPNQNHVASENVIFKKNLTTLAQKHQGMTEMMPPKKQEENMKFQNLLHIFHHSYPLLSIANHTLIHISTCCLQSSKPHLPIE